MPEINLHITREELEDAIIILDMFCLNNLLDDRKKVVRDRLLKIFRNVWKKQLGNVPVNCPTCNKPLDTEMIG